MRFDQIEFGKKYRDRITGFAGVCTGKVEYQSEEQRILLEGVDSTGRPVEQWVCLSRVESVEE